MWAFSEMGLQVLSRLSQGQYVGAVSERLQDALESYMDRNPAAILQRDAEVCWVAVGSAVRTPCRECGTGNDGIF